MIQLVDNNIRRYLPNWDYLTEDHKAEIRYAVSQGWHPLDENAKLDEKGDFVPRQQEEAPV